MLKTSITLNGMRFYAHHGVSPQETAVGNWFEVTVRVDYPFERAMEDDVLEGTLDYAALYDCVRREMEFPSKLLEHVAGRIRRAVCRTFPGVTGGCVQVVKLCPPIPGAMASASVEVSW